MKEGTARPMESDNENSMQEWLDGRISLGTAANWSKDEIRIISEIAYSLAQQGCFDEAIVLFEGLLAVAPATAYFQAALGALHLRSKNLPRAIEYLDAALANETEDLVSLVNRGEAHLLRGDQPQARRDLEKALEIGKRSTVDQAAPNGDLDRTIKRARTLLSVHAAASS